MAKRRTLKNSKRAKQKRHMLLTAEELKTEHDQRVLEANAAGVARGDIKSIERSLRGTFIGTAMGFDPLPGFDRDRAFESDAAAFDEQRELDRLTGD